jgi:hypothetical protein
MLGLLFEGDKIIISKSKRFAFTSINFWSRLKIFRHHNHGCLRPRFVVLLSRLVGERLVSHSVLFANNLSQFPLRNLANTPLVSFCIHLEFLVLQRHSPFLKNEMN